MHPRMHKLRTPDKEALRQRCVTLTAVTLCLASGFLSSAAHADDTPGTFVTFTNGGTNVRNLFTVSADTITINGDESGNSQWSLSNGVTGRLLGISKLFLVLVDKNGNPTPGLNVNTTADAGYVKANAAALFSTRVDWSNDSSNSYSRFTDGENGSGFSTKDFWLTIGDPAKAKKGSTAKDEYGSFKFSSTTSLLDSSGKLKYDIGIDYLIQSGDDGATGRAYFGPSINSVPEPAFYQMSALCLLGGVGLLRLRKARRTI